MPMTDEEYQAARDRLAGVFTDVAGRAPNAEDWNDIDNKIRHTKEYSVFGGQGYDNAYETMDSITDESAQDWYQRFYGPGEGAQQEAAAAAANSGNTSYGNSSSGSGVSAAQLQAILDALQTNQGPDVDLSQIDPGAFPTFEVPGENLSPSIDQTLLNLMQFGTESGLDVGGELSALLDETRGGGVNSQRLNTRLQAARENLTAGELAAKNDMLGYLGDRGFASVPGFAEGPEAEGITRAFQPLQQAYLQNVRGIESDESIRADEARLDALTRATGWSKEQAATKLAAAQSGQERQQVMANIALGVLDRNIEWNQFLATFGLQREQLAYDIQNGRMENIVPLLTLFMQLFNGARGGYV